MVFQGLLTSVLQKAAGQYITGIDSKGLSVGVWSGEVVIKDVGLNAKNIE